ncbi:cytochrome P450 [Podospora appendiculata]|uniref:Cytochrome P450 n=1 Tax=Podospora appendiculata TaxID=314037 RepID=A0AAE0X172_9PEZI|nr:cytochrome P450 [Podospora appendiculata]
MLADEASPGLAIVILAVFLAFRYLLYPTLLSPLARIPNAHWSSPISRLWILGIRYTHRENRILHALHRSLGPVIRVGPNELSINGIDGVRTVYQGGFEKPDWYSVFDNYGVPCMFSTRPAAEHSARKRSISNIYSKSYIQSSQSASAQGREILYGRLLPKLLDSTSKMQVPHGIDMYSVFMATTMDFISAYIFGIENGTNLLHDEALRDHLLEHYKARSDYSVFDQELPRLTWLCRKIGIPFWTVDAANKELGEWCMRLCDVTKKASIMNNPSATEACDEPVVWNALVGGLAKETKTSGSSSVLYPTALTNVDLSVASELFDHVLAGQETVGITLSYISWRLSQSMDLQADLRAELLSLAPNMRLDRDESASMPDPKQLDALPLLHAVVMETLRLHAPIPGYQPRETPELPCQIGPYLVPGGVRIAASAYSLHRDEKVFPEPEVWNPTRWLSSDGDGEERKKRNRQFWAFSSGGRMCVGSNFAMHEMKLIIAAIYSNFTSHIVDDAGMSEQSDGYTGRPVHERLFLRFERVV